jgi:Spy/CpxP family protein refolding chaperone
MTANVRVVTDLREGVLKIPNAALRVKITGVEPATPASGPSQAPAGAASSTSFHWITPAFAQQGGGPGAMRERLTEGLQLSSEQQVKLDAALGELRPKFMALRDMNEGDRVVARERVTAEMRTKVNSFLTSEQKAKYLAMQAASVQGASPQATPAAPVLAIKPPAGGVAPAITGQGPLVDVRNRLVAELQMPQAQADKLDAIYAANRPKFGALRELPEAERGKARDRISADIRAQIETILTPAQKPRYAQLVAEAASRQGANSRGRIYLQGMDGKPVAYNVRLGVTDGTSTELMVMSNSPNADKLIEGATVITGVSAATAGGASKAPSGPRLPF